jgi:hypothetical protein
LVFFPPRPAYPCFTIKGSIAIFLLVYVDDIIIAIS